MLIDHAHSVSKHVLSVHITQKQAVARRLVQDNPGVLDVPSFKKTIEHAKQVMGPDLDVIDTLERRPAMLFQFQQGKDLIAYDEVPTQSGQP